MTKKTEALRVRLSALEKQALSQLAEDRDLSINTLMTKLVREVIGAGPHLFSDDMNSIDEATQQLAAIGRNLNQVVRAINSAPDRKIAIDVEYLSSIRAHVDGVAAAVGRLMERQKERWAPIREAASSDA